MGFLHRGHVYFFLPCVAQITLTPSFFIQGERDIMSYGPLGQVLSLPGLGHFLTIQTVTVLISTPTSTGKRSF